MKNEDQKLFCLYLCDISWLQTLKTGCHQGARQASALYRNALETSLWITTLSQDVRHVLSGPKMPRKQANDL